MPVDLYIGGAEHAVLHLLYARFWHKVLFDRGHVSTPEPFMKLVNQGMILGEIEYTGYTINGEPVSASEHDVGPFEGVQIKGTGVIERRRLTSSEVVETRRQVLLAVSIPKCKSKLGPTKCPRAAATW